MQTFHVAWIGPSGHHAGAGLAASLAVEALRRRGHRVDLLAADERARLHPGATQAQAALALRTVVERTVRSWVEGWRRERPQLVHIDMPGNIGRAAAAAALAQHIPITSSWHHLARYAPGGSTAQVQAMALDFHRRCQRTVVQNPQDEVILAKQGVPGLSCIGCGVDSERFHPRLRDAGLRASWGAGPEDPVLLWLGRIVPQKSPLIFAAACGAARAVHPGVRAVVAGDGPEAERLRTALSWASYVGLQTGETWARTVASADLLVFPSLSEQFGMVVTEAMASGLAVLGHARAAVAMHVADGVSGRVIAPGDISAFVEAAGTMVRDLPRLRQMGVAARKAAEPLTWDAVAGRWEQLFAGLISSGTPSASP